jgi:hypothetical protein
MSGRQKGDGQWQRSLPSSHSQKLHERRCESKPAPTRRCDAPDRAVGGLLLVLQAMTTARRWSPMRISWR